MNEYMIVYHLLSGVMVGALVFDLIGRRTQYFYPLDKKTLYGGCFVGEMMCAFISIRVGEFTGAMLNGALALWFLMLLLQHSGPPGLGFNLENLLPRWARA